MFYSQISGNLSSMVSVHQYTLFTRPGAESRRVMFLTMTPYFRFTVNVCSMARIILIQNPEDDSAQNIEVVIGDDVCYIYILVELLIISIIKGTMADESNMNQFPALSFSTVYAVILWHTIIHAH